MDKIPPSEGGAAGSIPAESNNANFVSTIAFEQRACAHCAWESNAGAVFRQRAKPRGAASRNFLTKKFHAEPIPAESTT